MTEAIVAHAPFVPTADDYLSAAKRRRTAAAFWTLALSALAAGSFVVGGIDNLLLPLVVLAVLLTPVLLWHFPRLTLYVVFAAACLFEEFPLGYADSVTDRVPFFLPLNTILHGVGLANVTALPFTVMEAFVIVGGVCSLLRAVFSKTVSLRAGVFFWPIVAYVAFVVFGWANGVANGGDFTISLKETRNQFYFLLVYLLAVNLVQDKAQGTRLLWTAAVCIGLKGVLYTFRRYVTLAGLPLSDQGVGSHEEAFLFDCYMVLLVILVLCKAHKRLQWLLWALLPFVALGEMACNRRAGTAALAIVLPVLFLAAYRGLPERRRLIGIAGAVFAAALAVYYPMFKDSGSILAQPARAIKSQFQPDWRDAGSNAYRDAENEDLMATIKLAPLQGYGYGRPMLHVAPIADISTIYPYWDIMTHNQILWVWMRVGAGGFTAFWLMIAAVLIGAGLTLRRPDADAETKAIALLTMAATVMLTVFGLLDLQLSNPRDVLFTGALFGLLASVWRGPTHTMGGTAVHG